MKLPTAPYVDEYNIQHTRWGQYLVSFDKVKEIVPNDHLWTSGPRSVSLIVPARSGRRYRYHVYRFDLERGDIIMTGSELPILHARAVARRSRTRDWKPITKKEMEVAKLPPTKLKMAKWRPFDGPSSR